MSNMPKRVRARLGAVATGLCAAGLTLVPSASALEPSDNYNFSGVTHNLQYVCLKNATAPLRDGELLALNNANITRGSDDCRRRDGTYGKTVRIQGIEELPTPNGTHFYSWGWNGNPSGGVWLYELDSRPATDISAAAGNGKSAPDYYYNGKRVIYDIQPTSIPRELEYTGPTTNRQYSYNNYGTPGEEVGAVDHTNLSWSWINKGGGGIVRAMMRRGETFYRSDVASIKLNSTNSNRRGWVRAVYGFFYNGRQRVYGWIAHSHQDGDANGPVGPVVYHFRDISQ